MFDVEPADYSEIQMNKQKPSALAGVAQWIDSQPVNHRVAGSIPSQGTCLGCRPGLQLGWYVRGN